jgi:hypothetical protein
MPPARSRPQTPFRATAGVAALFATTAYAQELAPQPPKQRGGFFVPMMTVAETHDSNLFFTQFPESDLVTRLILGVETGYRSTPFTIDVQASRGADFFERHPDFNTMRARTVAQLTIASIPAKPLTFAMFACYQDTKTPSELNVASGLIVGRSLATRFSATPAIEYRMGSRSTWTVAFPVAHDTLDGKVADSQTAMAGFDRRVSRRDALSLRYEHRWFHFTGGDKTERSTSDVVTFGWMGEVGERTLVLLRGGPRYAKGAFTAELLGTVKHRTRRGLATLTYSKSQATTLGKTGALDVQSVVATIALRVSQHLEVASGPGIYHNTLRGKHLTAVRLNVESLWRFASWFHLGLAYSFDLQQPDFGAPGSIRRGALMIKLLVSPEQRRPEGPTSEVLGTEAQ